MKPLKILVVQCIMLIFGSECIKAQIAPAGSYLTTYTISSLQIGNLSSAPGWLNTSQINFQVKWIPILRDFKNNSVFTFNATGITYYDLINEHPMLNWVNAILPVEFAAKENYGTTSTFKIKWESLKKIPFIDPAIAYYCPFKKTDELNLCNCRLYRFTAFVIPRMLQYQYPGADNTIIYPQAYLQPNYSFIERSK